MAKPVFKKSKQMMIKDQHLFAIWLAVEVERVTDRVWLNAVRCVDFTKTTIAIECRQFGYSLWSIFFMKKIM